MNVIRRLTILAVLFFIIALAAKMAIAQIFPALTAAGQPPAVPSVQSVKSISPISCNYTTGSTSGASVCTVSAVMSPPSPAFNGTYSGTNAQFAINANNGAITLAENDQCSSSPCNYSLSVTATPSNPAISPFTQSISITSSAIPVPPPANAGCLQFGTSDGSCFNTLAANFDFTGATASYIGGSPKVTMTPSNISSWLDCDGASSPLLYNNADMVGGGGPCAVWAMANDGGTQIVQGTWQPSYGKNNTALATVLFTVPGSGVAFPNEFYVEYRMRVPAATDTACNPVIIAHGGCPSDIWSYSHTSGTPVMEWDFQEMFGFNSSSETAESNMGNGPCPGPDCQFLDEHNWSLISGFTHNVYHTYGQRITQDGNGKIMYCWYLDGTQYNIDNGDGGTTPPGSNCREIDAVAAYGTHIIPNLNTPVMMIMAISATQAPITSPVQLNIQYLRVYTCSNWNQANTSANGFACKGSLISSNP